MMPTTTAARRESVMGPPFLVRHRGRAKGSLTEVAGKDAFAARRVLEVVPHAARARDELPPELYRGGGGLLRIGRVHAVQAAHLVPRRLRGPEIRLGALELCVRLRDARLVQRRA